MALVPDLGDGFIDNSLPYLLTVAALAASGGLHQELSRRGVSVPVWRVLAVLLERPGETVTNLSKRCLLQQPTMSKLLDRLEKDRLILRSPDQQDRRVVRVSLTNEGRTLATALVETAKQHDAALMARLSQGDVIKDGLRRLVAAHQDAGEAG
jgi:MarR family transcriptional regulator, organic hydroperoxide resistance regulator